MTCTARPRSRTPRPPWTRTATPSTPRPADPKRLWERGPNLGYPVSKTVPPYEPAGPDFTYHNADEALGLFEKSRADGFADVDKVFGLIRKTDPQLMAMRRIVYDNDHQAKTAVRLGLPPRWAADAEGNGWSADDPAAPRAFTHAGEQTRLGPLQAPQRRPGDGERDGSRAGRLEGGRLPARPDHQLPRLQPVRWTRRSTGPGNSSATRPAKS